MRKLLEFAATFGWPVHVYDCAVNAATMFDHSEPTFDGSNIEAARAALTQAGIKHHWRQCGSKYGLRIHDRDREKAAAALLGIDWDWK